MPARVLRYHGSPVGHNKKPLKNERTSQYWDSISSSMPPQSLWRAHSDQVNIALLRDWLGDRQFDELLKTDLFDETLGAGLYPVLKELGKRIHGIDVSAACVTAAREKYPELQARCADVRDLPYDDGQFDAVVSNSTLDHFPEKRDIDVGLGELFRVLRSGGELLITLDNLQNPIIGLRSVLPFAFWKRLGVVPYYVGRSLGRRGLVRALEKTGFQVIETRAIMHCPRVLAVPVAGALDKRASPRARERFLAWMLKFEGLGALPSRFFSGHFVAARAIKP
jgi:SAM-dependent methyltransferase